MDGNLLLTAGMRQLNPSTGTYRIEKIGEGRLLRLNTIEGSLPAIKDHPLTL
jgi:hypothetical protein